MSDNPYGLKSSEFTRVAQYTGNRTAILVCGDRWWNDRTFMLKYMTPLEKGTVIVHGGGSGAADFADICAAELGLPRSLTPAFGVYRRGATSVRNTFLLYLMLGLHNQGWKVTCWAFHDNLKESKTTKDMVQKCKDAKIPIKLLRHPEAVRRANDEG